MRKNTKIVHYHNEIVRYWSKLNFILKRCLIDSESPDVDKLSQYLYVTFRIIWEHSSEKKILSEIRDIDKEFLKRIKTFSWDKALIHKTEKEQLSILTATPTFMINQLLNVMDIDFLKGNLDFMNGLGKHIKITMRINKIHENVNFQSLLTQIQKNLKNNKVNHHQDLNIPELLWIPISQKNRVIKNSSYQDGNLIFQDKASAAVVQVISPKQEDKICDMCAAPGIKTSLIAQYMKNKGYVIAGEFLP
ncbi:MAG: hypothetical protein ACFE9Y_16705, partial [Promethearchaeota archaeon]